MADEDKQKIVWYPPPNKSSVKQRFTESWDFERALVEMKARAALKKGDDNDKQ